MSYSYTQINQFAADLSLRLQRRATSYYYQHWSEVQLKLNNSSNALKKANSSHSRYLALSEYVNAVARAKAYLLKKDEQSIFSKCLDSDDRNNYLDECVDWALFYFKRYKTEAPNLWQDIAPPTKLVVEKKATQSCNFGFFDRLATKVSKVIRDAAVDSFIASHQFQRLKSYYTRTLVNDLRDHSFFGLNLRVEKAPVLYVLLNKLETAQTMIDVLQVFTDFYQQNYGDYYVLNSGQNITTRLLNVFGMRSTTIYLIDELYETLSSSMINAQQRRIN